MAKIICSNYRIFNQQSNERKSVVEAFLFFAGRRQVRSEIIGRRGRGRRAAFLRLCPAARERRARGRARARRRPILEIACVRSATCLYIARDVLATAATRTTTAAAAASAERQHRAADTRTPPPIQATGLLLIGSVGVVSYACVCVCVCTSLAATGRPRVRVRVRAAAAAETTRPPREDKVLAPRRCFSAAAASIFLFFSYSYEYYTYTLYYIVFLRAVRSVHGFFFFPSVFSPFFVLVVAFRERDFIIRLSARLRYYKIIL